MATTLVIGNKNYSSWSLRPWLFLRQAGVPFDEVRLPLDTAEYRDGIGRWSPTRQVPVLRDGDLVVWDSLAICEYANERWLDGLGWPADPRARAVARSAAAEMHSGFSAMRTRMPMNVRRQPDHLRPDADAERDIARIQALWRELRTRFGGDGDFLCGGFGIVDAMFAPVCVRFRGYGVRTDDTASAYMDAIFALSPMREWVASARAETERIGFEEVPRMAAFESLVRAIADFPSPGILFRDIAPLLADGEGFAAAIAALAAPWRDARVDAVAGIEARGFIFGAALARELDTGFVPLRKPGKLPGTLHEVTYALEYGEDRLQVQAGALPSGARVLLVDDVLATGGTLIAAARLLQHLRIELVGAQVLIELDALAGRARWGALSPLHSVLRY